MSDVNISINGRIYEIGCDPGQENRILELASYIDNKLQMIARTGAAYNETHLMVLTMLMLTDELADVKTQAQAAPRTAKNTAAAPAISEEDEKALANTLENLVKRIDGIADKLQAA